MKEPGERLSGEQEKDVIRRFWAAFRDPTKKGGPTWLRFRSSVRVTPAIFESATLDECGLLYVFFEHERKVRAASALEVRIYLEERSQGEYADVYFFPTSMEWCIAYTAEESGGDDVILFSSSSGISSPWMGKYGR